MVGRTAQKRPHGHELRRDRFLESEESESPRRFFQGRGFPVIVLLPVTAPPRCASDPVTA